MKLILLDGGPACGKNTLGALLVEEFSKKGEKAVLLDLAKEKDLKLTRGECIKLARISFGLAQLLDEEFEMKITNL